MKMPARFFIILSAAFLICGENLLAQTAINLSGDGSINLSTTTNVTNTFVPPPSQTGNIFMWWPSKAALRFGYFTTANAFTPANIGTGSIAGGENAAAQGDRALALGSSTSASGAYSTALGYGSVASGAYSTAMAGGSTDVTSDWSVAIAGSTSGNSSYAFGGYAYNDLAVGIAWGEADGYGSAAIGQTIAGSVYGTAVGFLNLNRKKNGSYPNKDAHASDDPIFEVGNGDDNTWNPSNALTVFRDGTLRVGTSTAGVSTITLTPSGAPSLSLGSATLTNNGGAITTSGAFTSTSGTLNGGATGLTLNAGGTGDQNITLNPTGSGYTKINGYVGIGTNIPNMPLHVKGVNLISRFEGTGVSALATFTPAGNDEWRIGAGDINLNDFGIRNNTRSTTAISISGGASGGNVGIGRTSPATALDVNGNVRISPYSLFASGGYVNAGASLSLINGNINQSGGNEISSIRFGGMYNPSGNQGDSIYNYIDWSSGWLKIRNNQQTKIQIGGGDEWGYRQDVYINPTGGNVGIGTTRPDKTLTVNGGIHCSELIIDTNIFPDYVFDKNYRLASLTEVETHIRVEGHLPGLPSAKTVSDTGVSVGVLQTKLLEKIEELTLHMIRLEKENNELRQRMQKLETAP